MFKQRLGVHFFLIMTVFIPNAELDENGACEK